MKQFVWMICVSCITSGSFAQGWSYQMIAVTTNKTTTLVFPSAVARGDIGSPDVISEEVKENSNILFLKAARAGFPETNINVVTTDGRLYNFTLRYDLMPVKTVYNIDPCQAVNRWEILFGAGILNPASIENAGAQLLHGKAVTHGIKDNIGDVFGTVNGIYIKENILFFRLKVDNASAINYDVDFIRFSLQDNKVGKRTATQVQELKPVLITGDASQVKAGKSTVAVFAFQKFTIPDKKSLIIQIGEKDGGRFLELRVKNRKLFKAVVLGEQ